MEAVLGFVPEEEREKYSALTGQSLFYFGEGKSLRHKILAIAEEEGAEKAGYALKLLQSEGELSIASTGKDPQTGRLVTQEYRVEGPVMIFLTTTAIEIDEELLNRCLVLTVDEGIADALWVQPAAGDAGGALGAALLAWLAAHAGDGMQRRDTALALFWPELDAARARAAWRAARPRGTPRAARRSTPSSRGSAVDDLSLFVLDIVQNSIVAEAADIAVAIREDSAGDTLVLTVVDDGRGMDPATVQRAVDPFYTTRTTRKVGLGLPLFRNRVEQRLQFVGIATVVDRRGACRRARRIQAIRSARRVGGNAVEQRLQLVRVAGFIEFRPLAHVPAPCSGAAQDGARPIFSKIFSSFSASVAAVKGLTT